MTILTPILICLAVAAILGALWLFAPEAALQATISVGVIAALGISGGIIGELLPRRWFHWDCFPYKTCAWEKNGKIYEKMGISTASLFISLTAPESCCPHSASSRCSVPACKNPPIWASRSASSTAAR